MENPPSKIQKIQRWFPTYKLKQRTILSQETTSKTKIKNRIEHRCQDAFIKIKSGKIVPNLVIFQDVPDLMDLYNHTSNYKVYIYDQYYYNRKQLSLY